jgi:hypothetical protein
MMTTLAGLTGTNPRDFLAALGLLRVLAASHRQVRLHFNNDSAYAPEVDGIDTRRIIDLVVQDAASQAGPQPWRLEYDKTEKRGTKRVADLKPPPAIFRAFAESALTSWTAGLREGAGYAAGFATDIAVDGKGNTKPTALHFTAANQQFLATVEGIRSRIDRAWCEEALFVGHADRCGPNLRWDPAADRAYALMAADPNKAGTALNAPLEWLAFRALPLLPVIPLGTRAETTCVRGRGDEMQFRWPLWSTPAALHTVVSLIRLNWWQDRIASHGWVRLLSDRAAMGVIAICTSEIRRSAQGFGNFGPAELTV